MSSDNCRTCKYYRQHLIGSTERGDFVENVSCVKDADIDDETGLYTGITFPETTCDIFARRPMSPTMINLLRFQVRSRKEIERLTNVETEKPYGIISVNEPNDAFADIPHTPNCRGILRLVFDDVLPPAIPGIKLFTIDDAHRIYDAIESWGNIRIYVHCWAGISRSAAIAAALTKAYTKEDIRPYLAYHWPNNYVYAVMRSAWTARITRSGSP